MHWRLNRVLYPVTSLGPGRRVGIWAQGCSLGCSGCVSRDLWPAEGGADVSVEQLAHWVADRMPDLDGVTITGGEPFQQYAPLMAFCLFLRQVAGVDVAVYSGYRLAELEQRHPDRLFTRCIDYLVDGRYDAARPAREPWRGSSNQRLIQFVDGAPVSADGTRWGGPWTVAVGAADVYLAGIPRRGALRALRAGLSARGVKEIP